MAVPQIIIENFDPEILLKYPYVIYWPEGKGWLYDGVSLFRCIIDYWKSDIKEPIRVNISNHLQRIGWIKLERKDKAIIVTYIYKE